MKKGIIYSLVFILITCSCTISKRLYMSGYYVQSGSVSEIINRKNTDCTYVSNNLRIDKSIISDVLISDIYNEKNLFASNNLLNDEFMIFYDFNKEKTFLLEDSEVINIVKQDSCDNIILKDGNEIVAKVFEIGLNEVKYKKCNNFNGPMYTIRKSEVFMIKYANGTKDIFSADASKEKASKTKEEMKLRKIETCAS